MPAVFINYRREESSGEARALFNDLVDRLGSGAVFMDVDSIAPGQDFRDVVQKRLSSCDVMLALVGREWLTVTTHDGRRRLDDPADFVRLEIEAALKRKIPVAPVLLHGTTMPPPDQLPEALRDFAFRNAFELSHTRWESDVQEMLRRLALLDERPSPDRGHQPMAQARHDQVVAAPVAVAPGQSRRRTGILVGVAIALAILAVLGYVSLNDDAADNPATEIDATGTPADNAPAENASGVADSTDPAAAGAEPEPSDSDTTPSEPEPSRGDASAPRN